MLSTCTPGGIEIIMCMPRGENTFKIIMYLFPLAHIIDENVPSPPGEITQYDACVPHRGGEGHTHYYFQCIYTVIVSVPRKGQARYYFQCVPPVGWSIQMIIFDVLGGGGGGN